MFRIALLLAFLLPAAGGAWTAVWERTGPSADPDGKPTGQSQPPTADTGPSSDPWGG